MVSRGGLAELVALVVRAIVGRLVGYVLVALVEVVDVNEGENDGVLARVDEEGDRVLARVEDSEVVELAEFDDGEVLTRVEAGKVVTLADVDIDV